MRQLKSPRERSAIEQHANVALDALSDYVGSIFSQSDSNQTYQKDCLKVEVMPINRYNESEIKEAFAEITQKKAKELGIEGNYVDVRSGIRKFMCRLKKVPLQEKFDDGSIRLNTKARNQLQVEVGMTVWIMPVSTSRWLDKARSLSPDEIWKRKVEKTLVRNKTPEKVKVK